MNILPKKSWHVFNKDNMAKVRADEAEAADGLKEIARRKSLAEQEARTQMLRDRASKKRGGVEKKAGALEQKDKSKDVALQLFAEEASSSGNTEHALEKKAEKEEWEKKMGILQYLGQDSAEASGVSPWYEKKRKRDEMERAPDMTGEVDAKKKRRDDPMTGVEKAVQSARKHHDKHKNPHKQARRSAPVGIEQLRAQRIRRERAERSKAQDLINRYREIPDKPKAKPAAQAESSGYNSQFNPQLTQQSKAYRDQKLKKLDFDWER